MVFALVAGADGRRALLLGVAMVALQVSIGSLNDLVDIERDRDRKPGKPIPAALVGRDVAWAVALAGLVVGLTLSAIAGPFAALVAIAGAATGYLYDFRLKATPWAWLPFAVGLPLLPVYAWVGAAAVIPVAFFVLVPLGVVAGAAVALLNGLVDLERDRASGARTPAVELGAVAARRLAAILLATVAAGVVASLAVIGARPEAWAIALGGMGLTGVGLVLVGAAAAPRRERGWEACAVGIGLLATAWSLGLAWRGLL